MLALTSPTSGRRSVGIVRSRIQATELVLVEYFERGSNEVLPASVLVKSYLENREYGRRGSAALTMRHPSIRKSWHYLHRQAAGTRSV
jgi:hypothetical protein